MYLFKILVWTVTAVILELGRGVLGREPLPFRKGLSSNSFRSLALIDRDLLSYLWGHRPT